MCCSRLDRLLFPTSAKDIPPEQEREYREARKGVGLHMELRQLSRAFFRGLPEIAWMSQGQTGELWLVSGQAKDCGRSS